MNRKLEFSDKLNKLKEHQNYTSQLSANFLTLNSDCTIFHPVYWSYQSYQDLLKDLINLLEKETNTEKIEEYSRLLDIIFKLIETSDQERKFSDRFNDFNESLNTIDRDFAPILLTLSHCSIVMGYCVLYLPAILLAVSTTSICIPAAIVAGVVVGLTLITLGSVNRGRYDSQRPYFIARSIGNHAKHRVSIDEQYRARIDQAKQTVDLNFFSRVPSRVADEASERALAKPIGTIQMI